ncbi:hypothetical protein SSIL_1411 [Solibacillus silvestris StLB046]|uniref:Uncharacterized protein n=1 Tax=Solibacillus silvestris (strain StLB046) TaxID=1002809 RepID=F2F2J6_SOLSS|nr:hypothetical protein [Solibacillus silvestris]BAK15834.1 hypothetical protein SSIL_1411 [Solibacillus silvestris StLB046]
MANRGRPKDTSDYALYKGDELLAIGTLDELAEFRGVSRNTIYWYSMPANKRQDRGNKVVAIKLED